jgi:hypothetical protein
MRESVQSLSCELDVFLTAGDIAISSRAAFSRGIAQVQLDPLLVTASCATSQGGSSMAGRYHQAQISPILCRRVASKFTIGKRVIRTPSLPASTA